MCADMWSLKVHACFIMIMTLFLFAAKGHQDVNIPAKQTRTIKMRHYRHSPSSNQDNYIGERLQSKSRPSSYSQNDEKDNHKPVFVNCSHYQPVIKEEQPTGLFVIQVRAIDKDPPERGGSITYSFVVAANDPLRFKINSQTGVITTKHMFNRDEPAREKDVYVTVRASDNGKPQLDDICRFKVIIEDINDNTPTFDKVEYRESIPQDMQKDSEVMRVSATDIDDGENRLIYYDLIENVSNKFKYFKIDQNTGIMKLNHKINDKLPGYEFKLRASATDRNSEQANTAYVSLIITVVESDKKPPYFTFSSSNPVLLLENFTDYSANIATFTAESNTEEKSPRFTLVTGNSEQTNKKDTFRLVPSGNSAHIRLGGAVRLDYEELSEYTLIVRVENKYNLGAEHKFNVQLIDVNDMFPVFSKEINSGMVLENEPPGTPVMQVSAIDGDVSSEFRKITYSLEDNQDKFAIDPNTGNITTKVMFDRETQDVYNVKVVAVDGAPSALFNDGQLNSATQVFKIEIADRNDNRPYCESATYEADVSENADLNAPVTEVHAKDKDSASTIRYSIQPAGNMGDAFYIEPETGKIKVKNKLDYEKITGYVLQIVADDSLSQDTCTVVIKVQNVDDNPPVFLLPPDRNMTLYEEKMDDNCLTIVQAYDPDIPNKNDPQNITYFVLSEELGKFLDVNESGCVRMLKPLDRDLPNGSSFRQVLIQAVDKSNSNNLTDLWITLIDVNDNAPFLTMPEPVIWRENQQPGSITILEADDYDSLENGKPFTFELAPEASSNIRSKFSITGTTLNALVTFDREKQKEYVVPISITDSGTPSQTGVSYLTVIIGDENDNLMKEGFSSIFVYSLEGHHIDIQIGRVYVEDPDDWDLPDKRFYWDTNYKRELLFSLDVNTGMITMSTDVEPRSYILHFQVHETLSIRPFESHEVNAVVNVTLNRIPVEAVDKSGSIRFEGVSAEAFVTKNEKGESRFDILKSLLSKALNNSEDNIDVFTVLHSPKNLNKSQLDVRFSAHGSPYYASERINSAIVQSQKEFEEVLNVKILMVNIDECMFEKVNCESSCWNHLMMTNEPAVVYTNATSFIGVSAYIEPNCECRKRDTLCTNASSLTYDGRCECNDVFGGPYCEQNSIGFSGNGWALYPAFDMCEDTNIVLYVRAAAKNGLIFYVGPESHHASTATVPDFIALELRQGYPVLLVNYGSGTAMVEHKHESIVDDEYHKMEIILKKESIELKVDDCQLQKCMNLSPTKGGHKYLNIKSPLQVGGTYMDLSKISIHLNWENRPTQRRFSGCIRNFTVNNNLYNLGVPSFAQNHDSSCSQMSFEGIVFNFDWPFFIAIIISLAVLTILMMAVAVHRRKAEDMFKDSDDIRENIINYEDEGGGEGDTAYDLNVLRLQYDESGNAKYNAGGTRPVTGAEDTPDICGFFDGKKRKKRDADNDPETLPFDDVKHYAYEGDGNTTGSLSSLASGTDEGDLNFDYLSNFGPRFRKLADMYGEEDGDEESDIYS